VGGIGITVVGPGGHQRELKGCTWTNIAVIGGSTRDGMIDLGCGTQAGKKFTLLVEI